MRALALAFLCCVLSCAANARAAESLAEAQTLLQQGKATEAYALLEAQEFDRAGDPDFDYTMAMAALGAGMPDKATLALERLLAVNPDSQKGRLAMARAYYELGDDARAEAAFQQALDSNPDASTRSAIAAYLERIKTRKARRERSVSAYLEINGGYDSNINSTPDLGQYTTPSGGDLTLSNTSDGFWGSAAGFAYSRHHNKQNSLFVNGGIRQRKHLQSDSYDSHSVMLQTGWDHHWRGGDSLRMDLLGGRAYQDGEVSRDTLGGDLEWRAGPAWRWALQYLQLRHPASLNSNDVNLYTFTATWSQSSLYLTGLAGLEADINDRDDGSKRFAGLRMGWQTSVGQRSQVTLNLSAVANRYDQESIYFLATRAENRYDSSLTWNTQINKRWSVRPQIGYSLSQSNFALYDYDRFTATLNLRCNFGD